MKNVSIHGTITTNKFVINQSLQPFSLLYSTVGVSLMIPGAVTKNICTPFSTVLSSFWEISCLKLSPCSSEMAAMFSVKNSYWNAEIKFIDTQL